MVCAHAALALARRSLLSPPSALHLLLRQAAPLTDSALPEQLLLQQPPATSAAVEGSGPGATQQKSDAQALVVLLLLAQAAGCLAHHGVRVSHLFMRHMLEQLPQVASLCSAPAAELAAAHAQVGLMGCACCGWSRLHVMGCMCSGKPKACNGCPYASRQACVVPGVL